MLPPPQGLSSAERAFYDAIVDLSGNEEKLDVGLTPAELAAAGFTGKPYRYPAS